MNAIQRQLPPSLMTALTVHLRKSGSTMSPVQAASAAIRAWIKAQEQADQPPPAREFSNGYQWKDLFLPEGTELRMSTSTCTGHARVVGDDIIFNGRKVSPRGMTLAIAGEGRNAWRDLDLKFPGERHFLPAGRCRREHSRAAQTSPAEVPAPDPAHSLNTATLALVDALNATLALMERSSARSEHDERRFATPRRENDVLADHCAF